MMLKERPMIKQAQHNKTLTDFHNRTFSKTIITLMVLILEVKEEIWEEWAVWEGFSLFLNKCLERRLEVSNKDQEKNSKSTNKI
jgi:hypothetical protein